MLVRTAILVASVFAASHSLAADPAISACQHSEIQAGKTIRFDKCATIAHEQGRAVPQIVLPASGLEAVANEEVGAPSHVRALGEIAVYASVQNRDAVAIEFEPDAKIWRHARGDRRSHSVDEAA